MLNTVTENNKTAEMETPNKELKDIVASQPGVMRVDLQDYGFKQAGVTGADPAALKNYLNDIHNGFIIDLNENEEEQKRERERREGEIDKLIEEKTTTESALRKVREAEIPAVKEKISGIKQQASQLDIERAKKSGESKRNSFSLNLYWPVFVMATIFLYGFYMSAFHTAFFKDMAKALLEADSGNISELLNTVFNKEAFTEFNLHWFAPIIFFVFSMVLHIVFEADRKIRAYLLAAMLFLILIADCLLAYFIEYNSHYIQLLNGTAEPNWAFYESPRFYLVLFLGFFTCLGWSMILHAIKEEYQKEDLDEITRLQKEQLRDKEGELLISMEELQKKAIDVESQIQRIAQVIERKTKQLNNTVYSVSDLEKRITAFYAGWLTFVANLKTNNTLKVANESVMTEFRNFYLRKAENQIENQAN